MEVEVDPTPPPVVEVKAILVNRSAAVVEDEEEETKEIDIGMPLKRINSTEIAPEYPSPIDKPLVSARFSHRKPLKFSPEGISNSQLIFFSKINKEKAKRRIVRS